jgi:hypothetical protein
VPQIRVVLPDGRLVSGAHPQVFRIKEVQHTGGHPQTQDRDMRGRVDCSIIYRVLSDTITTKTMVFLFAA